MKNKFKSTHKTEGPSENIIGYAGEWTAALILNKQVKTPFTTSTSTMRAGDILDWIEVKTSKDPQSHRWDLCCNESNLKENRVYLAGIGALFPYWMISTGWAWGHELKNASSKSHTVAGHTLKVLPVGMLKPVVQLFDEMRRRESES